MNECQTCKNFPAHGSREEQEVYVAACIAVGRYESLDGGFDLRCKECGHSGNFSVDASPESAF
jgi:hypothetical protein